MPPAQPWDWPGSAQNHCPLCTQPQRRHPQTVTHSGPLAPGPTHRQASLVNDQYVPWAPFGQRERAPPWDPPSGSRVLRAGTGLLFVPTKPGQNGSLHSTELFYSGGQQYTSAHPCVCMCTCVCVHACVCMHCVITCMCMCGCVCISVCAHAHVHVSVCLV